MKRLVTFSLMLGLLVPGAAGASDAGPGSMGRLDNAKRSEITARLTGEGYDVRKIEMEDGQIEVYALKDGKKLELYLGPDLNIVRTKAKE